METENIYPDNELFDRVRELIYSCLDNGDRGIFNELNEIIDKHFPEIKINKRIKLLQNGE